MKTKEEILSSQCNANGQPITNYIGQDGYVWKLILRAMQEYANQCQEDMADKKYTLKDLKEAFKQSRQAKIFEKDMPPVWESFEDYINSLNKQD
jgi:hypothetical protein